MSADSERGSAPAEFVMVGALLTVLTLAVMQLGLALHVRNTVQDAAGEGARFAALADNTLEEGRQRTADIISTAIGDTYASEVSVGPATVLDSPAVAVTVRAPLPVIGLIGVEGVLEVTAHAVLERTD